MHTTTSELGRFNTIAIVIEKQVSQKQVSSFHQKTTKSHLVDAMRENKGNSVARYSLASLISHAQEG